MTFWDTHRNSFSGELRQATDRFALVDEEIIDVVHDQLGKFSLQVTMVLWTLALQDEADEKNTSSGMENSPNSA